MYKLFVVFTRLKLILKFFVHYLSSKSSKKGCQKSGKSNFWKIGDSSLDYPVCRNSGTPLLQGRLEYSIDHEQVKGLYSGMVLGLAVPETTQRLFKPLTAWLHGLLRVVVHFILDNSHACLDQGAWIKQHATGMLVCGWKRWRLPQADWHIVSWNQEIHNISVSACPLCLWISE